MDRVEEFGEFKYRILFNKTGYTPHYAEYCPDGEGERLLMADPHMRRSILIYDIRKERIEWEYPVRGDLIPSNPHICRCLEEDIVEIGAGRGDILFSDRDNKWNIIDREGKVKFQVALPHLKWAHDLLPSKGHDGFIVTDYHANFVGKIDFKGRVIWKMKDIHHPAKLSVIEGSTNSGVHSNSLGGDYLMVTNSIPYGVYEIKDDDGGIVQRIPNGPGTINNFWCLAPHSAYRRGIVEQGGNLTVIGFEAGGGIVALDQNQRPRWGIMKGFTNLGGNQYIPSRYGLMETTHVFPTPSGNVGAIDWSGKMSSKVIEVLRFPRATLSFLLAWDFDPQSGAYLDPPLDIMEYDEILLDLKVSNGSSIEYSVWTTSLPAAYNEEWGMGAWKLEERGTLTREKPAEQFIDNRRKKRSFLRVHLKRGDDGETARSTILAAYS